jgi:hypothetical protein
MPRRIPAAKHEDDFLCTTHQPQEARRNKDDGEMTSRAEAWSYLPQKWSVVVLSMVGTEPLPIHTQRERETNKDHTAMRAGLLKPENSEPFCSRIVLYRY